MRNSTKIWSVLAAGLAASAFTVLPLFAQSNQISGADDADFTSAVTQWLDGKDLKALRQLRTLSEDGNAAAQILLASIASRGQMHVHVTGALKRADRVALLRKKGGLSGKSWLTEAQKTEPLAAALLQSNRIGEKPAAIAALIDFGEPQTALVAAMSLINNGEIDAFHQSITAHAHKLPSEADWIIGAARYFEQGGFGRYVGSAKPPGEAPLGTTLTVGDLTWGLLSPRSLTSDAKQRDSAIALAETVTSWTPIRNFCAQNCPNDVASCTATGGSFTILAGPFASRSPVMSLISNASYWASPRMAGDLARSFTDMTQVHRPSFEAVNTCFIDAMALSQSEHGHRP